MRHRIHLPCSDCDVEFVSTKTNLSAAIFCAEEAGWEYFAITKCLYCPKCSLQVPPPE